MKITTIVDIIVTEDKAVCILKDDNTLTIIKGELSSEDIVNSWLSTRYLVYNGIPYKIACSSLENALKELIID